MVGASEGVLICVIVFYSDSLYTSISNYTCSLLMLSYLCNGMGI
jgi:hypothetical protein